MSLLMDGSSIDALGQSGDGIAEKVAARTAIAAVAGGTASVLSGGKFANGAITGAFAQLYNGEGIGRQVARGFGTVVGGIAGGGVATAVAGGCTAASGGACALGAPALIGAGVSGGGATGGIFATTIYDAVAGSVANDNPANVHGNSYYSMNETEVYYLINNTHGGIDKIGITQYPGQRYDQVYLRFENVRYETQATYSWRGPAMTDENARLWLYRWTYGDLPRLNKTTR